MTYAIVNKNGQFTGTINCPPDALEANLKGGDFVVPSMPPHDHCTWDAVAEAWIMPDADALVALAWAAVRATRNALLDQSDKTQMADVPPATATLWRPYRQSLRDITKTYATPDAIVWPTQPI